MEKNDCMNVIDIFKLMLTFAFPPKTNLLITEFMK